MKYNHITSGVLLSAFVLAMPSTTYAAATLFDLIAGATSVVQAFTAVAFLAALVAFFWGLAKYLYADADDAKVSGRSLMVWGTIALTVAASVGGLIEVFQVTFQIDGVDLGSEHTCVPELGGAPTKECLDSDP